MAPDARATDNCQLISCGKKAPVVNIELYFGHNQERMQNVCRMRMALICNVQFSNQIYIYMRAALSCLNIKFVINSKLTEAEAQLKMRLGQLVHMADTNATIHVLPSGHDQSDSTMS